MALAQFVGVNGTSSGPGPSSNQRTFLSAGDPTNASSRRCGSSDSQFVAMLLPEGTMTTMPAGLCRRGRDSDEAEHNEHQKNSEKFLHRTPVFDFLLAVLL
jgi:hypothetical protein